MSISILVLAQGKREGKSLTISIIEQGLVHSRNQYGLACM